MDKPTVQIPDTDAPTQLVVEDLEAEHARLTEAGLGPRKLVSFAPDGGEPIARFFFIADPDGYQIEVLQRAGRYR